LEVCERGFSFWLGWRWGLLAFFSTIISATSFFSGGVFYLEMPISDLDYSMLRVFLKRPVAIFVDFGLEFDRGVFLGAGVD
jgi:hypothetical protein